MFEEQIKGFSLIELLFALTVSITGITGLMRYHQTLIYQFSYATEIQQTWQIAHQLLENYPEPILTLPKYWQYQFSRLSLPYLAKVERHSVIQCEIVKVQVESPLNVQAVLERLIC